MLRKIGLRPAKIGDLYSLGGLPNYILVRPGTQIASTFAGLSATVGVVDVVAGTITKVAAGVLPKGIAEALGPCNSVRFQADSREPILGLRFIENVSLAK